VMGAASVRIGDRRREPPPVVHERVVPLARPPSIQRPFDEGDDLGVANAAATGEKPVDERPADVGLDQHDRFPISERGHCPRGVGTHAGQALEIGHGPGHPPPEALHDRGGRPVQPETPAVVSEPLPQRERLSEGGLGEGPRFGVRVQERAVALDDAGDLCLLQHHLGHEDAPGIARRAPRQAPRVPSVARPHRAPEPGHERVRGIRQKAFSESTRMVTGPSFT